jgi:hypothetical protein
MLPALSERVRSFHENPQALSAHMDMDARDVVAYRHLQRG